MGEHERAAADDGFSLIEVVVAMMLLALLALVTLPLFMTGMRITSADGTTTSATGAVSSVLEQARVKVATAASNACSTLQQFASGLPSMGFHDAQNHPLSLTMTTTSCTVTPAPVTVTVTAADSTGKSVSTATTIIYVTS